MKKELQEDFIYSVLHWFQSLYMTVNIQLLNRNVETLQFCISCLFLLKAVLMFSVLLQNLQHHSSPKKNAVWRDLSGLVGKVIHWLHIYTGGGNTHELSSHDL